MNTLKKVLGRDVHGEQPYFDALYTSIHVNGVIMPLGGLLERSARLFPDNVAIICNDISVTYKELYFRALLLSQKITQSGVKPHDRVLLFFENSLEFYIGYFGIVQTGAVVAPLNTFLHETELRHIINDAQPSLVVTQSNHAELFKSIDGSLVLLTQQDMDMATPMPVVLPVFTPYRLDAHEMAALLYTSGTTGLPKGVMLSSKNIMTNIVQVMARLELKMSERLFGVLPLFHSFSQNTCVWTALFAGCTVIVISKIERRHIMDGLKHNPTIVLGVPALFGLFCLMKTAQFNNVKYFASGGDALPDKIRMGFELIYRRKICNGYGLTEASPVVSVDIDDLAGPTSNIGRPLIGIEIAIIDEAGNKFKQGSIGQLIVKGDNVMLGYYNAPEATHAAIKDGWLYTGDLAYIDAYGKIVITGRIKDLIIHKGFNIYPQEIENALLSHANVIRAAVVGKPDEATGQVPIAFVQLRVKQEGIEKELKAVCLKQLATYKVPKEFIVTTDDLPMTATGKVDKKVLRKRL